jgi:hypothetical protein
VAHKVGRNVNRKLVPLRYVTSWKPQDDSLKIPTVRSQTVGRFTRKPMGSEV